MKKISGDKNSSTFLHPSGHKITIAHNGVSPAQRMQLVSMPIHKADGGEVESNLNPEHALNQMIAKKGIVGGTVYDGSTDEKFLFDSLCFDIDKARQISNKQSNAEIPVSQMWIDKIKMDSKKAMESNSTNPVFVAQISTDQGIKPLLIDGNHRMFKAIQKGEHKIPAFVFSPKETKSLLIKMPDNIPHPKDEVQNFAKGGLVKRKHYADGTGDVNSSSVDQNQDVAPPVTTPSLASQIGSGIRSAYQAITPETPKSNEPEIPAGTGQQALSDFWSGIIGKQPTESQSQTDANAPASAQDLPDYGQPVQTPDQTSQRGAASVPSAPIGGENISGAYEQGLAGLREEQGVQTALAAQAANREQQWAIDNKALNDQGNKSLADIQKAHDDFNRDFMNNKIDPRAYVENMSTGQKVATAIGMLFGGIGSARTGAPNYAVDFLNKQIERNIAAQQSRMDQQKTLLGANEELYKDKTNALTATRINMTDAMMHQAQLAAAQQGTPTADAIYKQKAADWTFQRSQLMNQMAMRDAVLKAAANGNSAITAQHLVAAGIMNPEQAAKEQGAVNGAKQKVAQANNLFDQLEKEQTPLNVLNPQSYMRVHQIAAQMVPLVQDEDPSKRLTEQSYQKEIEPFIWNTLSGKQTRQEGRQGVLNLIKTATTGKAPTIEQYAPGSLPNYNAPGAQAPQQAQQYKVGQILRDRNTGQRIQIIDAKGNVKPVGNG